MTATPRRGADRAALRDRQHQEPTPERRAAVLTPEQLGQMLQLASPRDAALLAVMAAGACRIGETTLLCWRDIDQAGRVTLPGQITKTRTARAFTLPPEAKAYLDQWRQECPTTQAGWVFPGHPPRYPLSVRAGQRVIKQLAARVGLEGVTSHSLRRSAITAAHSAGLPLRALAELGGHQSASNLQRYLDADVFRAEADAARSLLFGAGPQTSISRSQQA